MKQSSKIQKCSKEGKKGEMEDICNMKENA